MGFGVPQAESDCRQSRYFLSTGLAGTSTFVLNDAGDADEITGDDDTDHDADYAIVDKNNADCPDSTAVNSAIADKSGIIDDGTGIVAGDEIAFDHAN